MEIYLDANATTPVLAAARDAAVAAMGDDYGNPSSAHGAGLKARFLMESVRACARRVLGTPEGQVLFVSGATEAIQMVVLSALTVLRDRRARGAGTHELLLYGATEHKAVPEAIRHWNAVLRLDAPVLAIPVGTDGRHDLAWLRVHAPRAGLVCTMAVNNETGIVSDLDGIAGALHGSQALWMVDGVQALGKLDLRLVDRAIDYAPFSGHKLYAPKGIGLLYVRAGAPITPLLAGGGQEEALRSGTENMPGIAALGAVLAALEGGRVFPPSEVLHAHRERLMQALQDAFPGIVFNAPAELSLPTTLNFSVPGLSAKLLLDLFDAAELRVSGGSACSAAKAQPSDVLQAMGLPTWRTASAVRLSFGPLTSAQVLDEACRRIRACGESLRESCMGADRPRVDEPPRRLTRHVIDGACCYVVADPARRRCVVIDPLPELTGRLTQWIACREYVLAGVLDTHSHGDHASSAAALRAALPAHLSACGDVDGLGWPLGADTIELGTQRLTRLAVPGHTRDSTAYLLHDDRGGRVAFVGDLLMPGALGRSDFEHSEPLAFATSLRRLASAVGRSALLLPAHDYDDRYACTLAAECRHQPLLAAVLDDGLEAGEFAAEKAKLESTLAPTRYDTMACGARVDADAADQAVELTPSAAASLFNAHPAPVLVDVREPYEQRLGRPLELGAQARHQAVPLSALIDALPAWLALPADTPVVFFCRSGNRSAQAAAALRRLGRVSAYSLSGGLALWTRPVDAGGGADTARGDRT